MSNSETFQNQKSLMIQPFMGRLYDGLAQPLAWVGFRALIGLGLVYESVAKVEAPFAQAGFVESIGFHPGWFWSPFLAYLQFVGGIAIAIGLLTRPFALANAVMLAITLWFHVAHPYGDAFLTSSGMDFLKSGPRNVFTPEALSLFKDAGAPFLEQVQEKAELLSLLWTGGAAFFAAFGGGPWSVDRLLIKREV